MSDETTPSANDASEAGGEPSMEDILASIRRIIADDDADSAGVDADMAAPDYAPADDNSNTDTPASELETADLVIGGDSAADIASAEFAAPELTTPELVVATDAESETSTVMDDLLDIDLTADVASVLDLTGDDITQAGSPIAAPLAASAMPSIGTDIDAPLTENLDIAAFDDDFDVENLLIPDVTPEADVAGATDDDIIPDERVIDPAADLLGADDDIDDTDALIDSLFDDVNALDAAEGPDDMNDGTEMLDVDMMSADMPSKTIAVSPTADSDLDLVKSLMADLTDDSFLDTDAQTPPTEIQQAEAADEGAAQNVAAPDVSAPDSMDDDVDVFDDILALTLDDEAALQDQKLDALAQESVQMEAEADTLSASAPSPHKSLADIAAEAQSEAAQIETPAQAASGNGGGAMLAAVMAAGGAAAAVTTAAVKGGSDADADMPTHDEIEALIVEGDEAAKTDDEAPNAELDAKLGGETFDLDMTADLDAGSEAMVDAEAIAPPSLDNPALDDLALDNLDNSPDNDISTPMETTDMAKAAAKDTILDDVTETAAAGAFAQLNTAVEEKAIVAERGDRIGDLVQEALRPMLKEWLDANLKGIVERAVAKEVKRISSGK